MIDNTLVDRVAAFRRWARQFVESSGLSESLVVELESIDNDGIRPRAEFFALCSQLHSSAITVEVVRDDYLSNSPSSFEMKDDVVSGLSALREAGHTIGIATNGPLFQEA